MFCLVHNDTKITSPNPWWRNTYLWPQRRDHWFGNLEHTKKFKDMWTTITCLPFLGSFLVEFDGHPPLRKNTSLCLPRSQQGVPSNFPDCDGSIDYIIVYPKFRCESRVYSCFRSFRVTWHETHAEATYLSICLPYRNLNFGSEWSELCLKIYF